MQLICRARGVARHASGRGASRTRFNKRAFTVTLTVEALIASAALNEASRLYADREQGFLDYLAEVLANKLRG